MDLNKTFSEFPEDTFCEIDEMSLDSQSFPKLDSGNISDISIHPYVVFNNNNRLVYFGKNYTLKVIFGNFHGHF